MKKIIVVGEYMWPWYQQAFVDGFISKGFEVSKFSWFDLFWIRLENNQLEFKSLLHKIQYRLLNGPIIFKINKLLIRKINEFNPDVVFLYNSFFISNKTLNKIKEINPNTIICQYSNDNPFSKTGTFGLWKKFISNIPYCDKHYIFRESNRADYLSYGAKNINILMPYFIKDKDFNVPIKSIPRNFHSDIVFAGHYEDDFRIEYLEDLILKGYNVKVFGGGWNEIVKSKGEKSPLYKLLPINPVTGEEYRYAICGSKIPLCFLSKINKDSYTRRNFEIPAMKKVLLSEYSSELSNMFIEDKEMVFFRNKAEFFKKIDLLLENESMREKIGLNGYNIVNKRHDSFARVEEIINTWK